jgi:hypothetical protein
METVMVKDSLDKTVRFRNQRRCNAVPEVESGGLIHNPGIQSIMFCSFSFVVWF